MYFSEMSSSEELFYSHMLADVVECIEHLALTDFIRSLTD